MYEGRTLIPILCVTFDESAFVCPAAGRASAVARNIPKTVFMNILSLIVFHNRSFFIIESKVSVR